MLRLERKPREFVVLTSVNPMAYRFPIMDTVIPRSCAQKKTLIELSQRRHGPFVSLGSAKCAAFSRANDMTLALRKQRRKHSRCLKHSFETILRWSQTGFKVRIGRQRLRCLGRKVQPLAANSDAGRRDTDVRASEFAYPKVNPI